MIELYRLHDVTLIAACPIKGQIRRECASHPDCHRACGSLGPVACPRVCIPDGCECPPGTVIDRTKNECVPPSECEECQSTYVNITYLLKACNKVK